MNQDDARGLLAAVAGEWLSDPQGDVVHVEEFEGRTAVRMAQRARDFTTVWFDVGERTVTFEAYVLPVPAVDPADVYRLALARNWGTRRARFALDRRGDLYVRGRIPLSELDREELDQALGEVWELVDTSFRPLVRAGFRREKKP